jgi:hypothetical protein
MWVPRQTQLWLHGRTGVMTMAAIEERLLSPGIFLF